MPTDLPEPIHVVLRYAESTLGYGDTIGEHQAVIREHGAVAFGKMGRPVGNDTIRRLNDQCEAGTDTYLLLVTRRQADLVVHLGQLAGVSRSLPSADLSLVPPYYAELGLDRQMGSWFRLSSLRASRSETLGKLVIAKTGVPVLSLVGSSRSSLFLARLKPGARLS